MDRHRMALEDPLSQAGQCHRPRGPVRHGIQRNMTWWQNLRSLWPGALRQQVTRTGLAYSGAIVIVTLAAVLSANNLLFLILAAMLSILAISGFVSKLTL